jgi:hypothetical protein
VNHAPTSVPEDQALTIEEQALVRWLLEHGEQHASGFFPSLRALALRLVAHVDVRASIFSIAGVQPATSGDMGHSRRLLVARQRRHLFGAFVFARGGLLAGLDLWSIDGQATATRFAQSQ